MPQFGEFPRDIGETIVKSKRLPLKITLLVECE